MKIIIDSNEAKMSSLGDFHQTPEIDDFGVWLPINVNQQRKSRWCWAAIASAVGSYYQTDTIEQEELVEQLLEGISHDEELYSKDEIKEQNVNFKLDKALKYVNSFSHLKLGKPIMERIQFEINQGRPFGVRIEWFKGGAHYVLVKGYNAEDGSLFIEDSLHGSSVQPYNQFPDEYREGGAVWTETYWTNKLITQKTN